MMQSLPCWCNNSTLEDYSDHYFLCITCHTLVSKIKLQPDTFKVLDDTQDYYGKSYWLSHQIDLGYPTIFHRMEADLSERCLYWLHTLLKYKLPPAKTLELGSSHGGFVALLDNLGFDAIGLELSPSIAELAQKTFEISVLTGPIENQSFASASLDAIILMDVLEHLPHPINTMRHCLNALKEDGILMIQTPNYPEKTYDTLIKENHPFLAQLKQTEHLYLFNSESIQLFFQQLDSTHFHIQFEPAFFSDYDMFLLVSRKPIQCYSEVDIRQFLNLNRQHRIIAAALDSFSEKNRYIKLYQEADADRIKRLENMHILEKVIIQLKQQIVQKQHLPNEKYNFPRKVVQKIKHQFKKVLNFKAPS